MDSRSNLPLALAFVAGCSLSALLVALLGPASSGAPAAALASTEPIVQELRRLRASVEQLNHAAIPGDPTHALPASAMPKARVPDLTPALQQLERTLAGLQDQLGSGDGVGGGVAAIPRARESKRQADWGQLLPIARHMTEDDELAKRGVRFLTVPELLSRFGPPDHVWASNEANSVRWTYERMGMWEGEETSLSEVGFRIQDGYVIDAWGNDVETDLRLQAAGSFDR